MNRFLLTILLAIGTLWALPAHAASSYEDSMKQLAEGVVSDAVKAKKELLVILDFTNAKGRVTPIGKFLAEELRTQIMVAGELKVVDRKLAAATLKKMKVTQLDPAQASAIEQAAKTMHADIFAAGSYSESPGDVQVTVKLFSPSPLQSLAATRSTVPKTGQLGDLLREANKPPVVKIDRSTQAARPPGLGTHSNEYYQLVVTAFRRRDKQVRVDLTIENKSTRDIKALCLLQNTVLEDEHGAQWKLEAEDNREGLCTRAIELSPREKDRAVLIFSVPTDAGGGQFIFRYHEKLPRPDAIFSITGLTAEAAGATPATTDAPPPPSQ